MNKRLLKRLDRYQDIAKVLDAAPAGVPVPPGFAAKVAQFHALIAEIRQVEFRQLEPIPLVTAKTREVFEDLIETTLHIAGVIGIVARDLRQPQLAEEVQLTRDTFVRLRAEVRTTPAARVADAVRKVAPHLVVYGVTDTTLADFEAKIETARQAAAHPRMAIVNRTAATRELNRLFAELDDLLTSTIDCLVRPLRRADEGFRTAYDSARTTPLRPRTRRKKRAAEAPAPAAPEESAAVVPA